MVTKMVYCIGKNGITDVLVSSFLHTLFFSNSGATSKIGVRGTAHKATIFLKADLRLLSTEHTADQILHLVKKQNQKFGI